MTERATIESNLAVQIFSSILAYEEALTLNDKLRLADEACVIAKRIITNNFKFTHELTPKVDK